MYVCGYVSSLKLDHLIDVNILSGISCSVLHRESDWDVPPPFLAGYIEISSVLI